MMDYPGLTDKKHIFEEINVDELLKMINEDETFVAVLGFPECPWCRAIMPHLNDAGKEEGLKEIYYVNILEMREETSSDHAKYLELKEYLEEKSYGALEDFVKKCAKKGGGEMPWIEEYSNVMVNFSTLI